MTLSLDLERGTVGVVCSKDSAIGIDDEERRAEVYAEYLSDLDEDRLQLTGEPTRFLLSKVLPYKAVKQIKNEQMAYSDGKADVRLGFILEEVRAALVGVENPGIPELAFKKDSDGLASRRLLETLEAAGIVNELYAARQGAVAKKATVGKKS